MKRAARRLTKLEQTTRAAALSRNSSSVLSAIENACSEGRIAEAALISWNYLEGQIAKYENDQDAVVQLVLQDPVLSKLSVNSLVQIRDFCKEMRGESP